MPIVHEETPEQIQARRPPKPRHHTISEEAEQEQLGRKQAWKQAQAERQPVPLRPPRPQRIGGPPRTATFVNEALGRVAKTVPSKPITKLPPAKRPRRIVEMDDDSSDEEAMQTEVPTNSCTMPSAKEQEALAKQLRHEQARAETVAAQKVALEKRVAAAKAAADKEAERQAQIAKRLAAEKAKREKEEAEKAAAAEKAKEAKVGKKPVVPARTHTTPIDGYLQPAFHPFTPSEVVAARSRYNANWSRQLGGEDDPHQKAVIAVRAIRDLSNHCAITLSRRCDPIQYWMDNIVQELEQREWVNPIQKGMRKEDGYLQILTAARQYGLFVFAELPGLAGNRVVDRVELLVYNKERAANRALIKQMTTKLHRWCAAQGFSVEVHAVKEMMEAEDKEMTRLAPELRVARDKIDNPTDINTRLKDPDVTLRRETKAVEIMNKYKVDAQQQEHEVMIHQQQYNSMSYERFQESMAATDAYFNFCKENASELGVRRNLLTTNVNQANETSKTLEKEVARQKEVIEKIEKRYWTPRLQACDDADAMAVWLSKRNAEWGQLVDLCRRSKVRASSLREIHTRNHRFIERWQQRAGEANALKLKLYAHMKHATVLGAPLGWKPPVPTRVSTLPYAKPPAPAVKAEDDDVVEVVGEKSWAERDKELRAQAQYVG